MSNCETLATLTERLACTTKADLEAAIERIEALEAQNKPDMSALDWLTWLTSLVFDNLDKILLLFGLVAAFYGLRFLIRFLQSKDTTIKEATIKIGGTSITVEKATQKINQLLLDVQDHVIGQTATRRRDEMIHKIGAAAGIPQDKLKDILEEPPTGAFSDPWPEQQAPGRLDILWVSNDTDIIEFEQSVLERMGNTIEQALDNDTAMVKLRHGNRYDLILSDMDRDDDPKGGERLFEALLRGVHTDPWVAKPHTTQIGPDLRFAVYTRAHRIPGSTKRMMHAVAIEAPLRIKAMRQRILDAGLSDAETETALNALPTPDEMVKEITRHFFLTPDFPYLQERVQWLQRAKVKPDTV